ncbi:MAG: dockerin type I domain-containing protein [Promethearchaeota archaeon]
MKWKKPLGELLLLGVLILAFNIRKAGSLYPPPTEWTRTYGINGNHNEARSLVQTSDGGFAVLGFTRHYVAGWVYTEDFWLVKTDPAGNAEWNRTYGVPTYDDLESGRSVVQTDDGGYALAGYAGIYGQPIYYDFWLVKTDSLGNMEWNQTYGGADIDCAYSLVQTSDGGYVMTGGTSSYGAGKTDVYLVKTDSTGNMEWNQTYGGADIDCAYSVVQAGDGEYVVAGLTDSYGAGNRDFWLIKTDAGGNTMWNQTYGGTEMDWGYSVVRTSDGGYAIAGFTESFGAGIRDFWLVKTDSSGNMEWNQTYGGTQKEEAYSLVQTSDGGYALVGWTNSSPTASHDFWLVKTDSTGNMEWNQTYGGTGSDVARAWSVVQTVGGGYAMAGYIHFYSFGVTDFWLVKTCSGGDVNGDGVVDIFDLSIVGRAYGSFEGEPEYNPDADLNKDGIVDIGDISMVCMNYGVGG